MVYILLGNGFEEMEAIAPLDLLRRAGVDVLTVGLNGKQITGAHDIVVDQPVLLWQFCRQPYLLLCLSR